MRSRLATFLAATLAFPALAAAQSKLKVEVITASPSGFLVTAALVSGEKDAVLVDSAMALSDAHRVVARVLESGKNLTTVYVTHAHPDHYFGLVVLKQAFPKVKLLALPAALAEMKATWKGKVAQWGPMMGQNLSKKPVLPVALKGSTIDLEGDKLEIVGGLQGDGANSSYVWIASAKTVIAGDIVFDGVHPWTAETTAETRKQWIAVLDQIAALKPAVVVAGHQVAEAKQDPKNVDFTKKYLLAFDEALAASKTSDELQTKVKAKYGKLALDIILKIGADAAFAGKAPTK